MIEHDEYVAEKAISSSSRSEVWSGQRRADGCGVALKCYRSDRMADGHSHARREYDALRAVESPGVVRALDLLVDTSPPCLVLELLPGRSLAAWVSDEGPLPIEAVLTVAIELARAFEGVHAQRLIHRDLTPANIQVDPETRRAWLIDFGSTRSLGRARPHDARGHDGGGGSHERSQGLGAGLAYMSPEQTGRMDRGVDSRSDLYGLGACLYFALAGRGPFELSDTLALLHALLARVPTPLCEVDARVPVAVSRIVGKLLEKEPERRYQSARALVVDLEICLDRLRSDQAIPADLALGSGDAPIRPIFRRVAYGREAEVAQLQAAFEASRVGSAGVVFVAGGAGAGKSSLVGALRTAVAEAGGHLASGDCDPRGDSGAHAALRTALASLTDQMLCAGEAHFEAWTADLRDGLADLLGVATDFVPGLSSVVGDAVPPPALGAREAAVRLSFALERFLRVCARPERPLVLFLDGVHLIGQDSLGLLDHLMSAIPDAALLWVLAYRSDQPGRAAGLRARVAEGELALVQAEVDLAPLARDALAQMIGDALAKPPEAVGALVDAAVRKTDGSPLMVQEFVLHLHADARIRAAPEGGWTWDDADVAGAEIHEGAVALLCSKLNRLPEATRTFASFLSCQGDAFDAEWIAEILEEEVSPVELRLFALADAGLLTPGDSGFRFAHGRIRDAANALLEPVDAERIHHATARKLLARTPFERLGAGCAEISRHLQRAARQLEPSERIPALAIHLAAGQQALGRGAYEAAREHLAAARAQLREEDWDTDPARAVSILHDSAEAEFLAGELEAALALADALVARDLGGLAGCRARAKRLRVLTALDAPNVIPELLASLRVYGVRWRPRQTRLERWLKLTWLDWRLRGPLDERQFPPPTTADLSPFAPMLLLSETSSVLLRARSPLLTESIRLNLLLLRRFGTVRSPALSLAALGAARIEVLGHWRGLERYAEAALEWASKGDDWFAHSAQLSLCTFSLVWLRPRRELLAPLRRAMRGLHEAGQLDHTRAAFLSQLSMSALVGRPLPELLDGAGEARQMRRWPQVQAFLRVFTRAYETLADRDAADSDWGARTRELEGDLHSVLLYGRIHWLIGLCLFEQYELAWGELARTTEADYFRGSLALPEYHLLRGLCAAHRAAGRGAAARRARRRLRREERFMRARARHAPDFGPAAAFLGTEIARLSGGFPATLRAYSRAIEAAREARYIHLEGWLHERRGRFLIEARRSRDAVPALERATALYDAWGAKAKRRQVEALLASVRREI